MIRIEGKHSEAVVYTDQLEQSAAGQILALCDQAFTKGARIRVMPDVHAGAGCVIGTTMTIHGKIVPNLVGVDIGCGMETVRIDKRRVDFHKLDTLIRRKIPSGMNVREKAHAYAEDIDLTRLRCGGNLGIDRGYMSIGTLGGGNHFIEMDIDDEGKLYLVVHSGSRHLGLEVAQYYQQAAWDQRNGRSQVQKEALIGGLRERGREKDIEAELKALKKEASEVPFALAYAEGELFEDYLSDMALMQRFADLNRKAMVREILRGMKWDEEERFTTVHNYIDTHNMILRKGAVSAAEGQRLLIPINMRDGSLICTGKGNEDWNFSAPHGAGRLMSRKAARDSFTLNEFKKQMTGIFSTTVAKDTLDECPMAYKSMETIINSIGPTAIVYKDKRPLYNFNAG
ncbi:MAG: RtcB family protein [Clostridia bacterium]|nr:RtcB family protein [Clostridia bacterium]